MVEHVTEKCQQGRRSAQCNAASILKYYCGNALTGITGFLRSAKISDDNQNRPRQTAKKPKSNGTGDDDPPPIL
jgi:hypothetical protein